MPRTIRLYGNGRRYRLPFLFCLLLGLAAAGCTDRHGLPGAIATEAGWQRQSFAAGGFTLTGYLRPGPVQPAGLAVYVEGDGVAFITPRQISSDPTPDDPTALRLALRHPTGAVLYLARPCQYAPGDLATRCDVRYWTTHRYAPEIVAALDAAIDAAKRQTGAGSVALYGYSGGGTVAALLAARRSDVSLLVTAAANLDHATWTARKELTPLAGSLNPADQASSLAAVPQYHFVGAQDAVVPSFVVQAYADRFPAGRRPTVRIVEGFDHRCCWVENWAGLVAEAIGR